MFWSDGLNRGLVISVRMWQERRGSHSVMRVEHFFAKADYRSRARTEYMRRSRAVLPRRVSPAGTGFGQMVNSLLNDFPTPTLTRLGSV